MNKDSQLLQLEFTQLAVEAADDSLEDMPLSSNEDLKKDATKSIIANFHLQFIYLQARFAAIDTIVNDDFSCLILRCWMILLCVGNCFK